MNKEEKKGIKCGQEQIILAQVLFALRILRDTCCARSRGQKAATTDTRATRLIRLPRLRTADLPRPREARSKGYNPGGSETDREEQKGSAALGRCLLGSAFLLRPAKGKRARRLLLWA